MHIRLIYLWNIDIIFHHYTILIKSDLITIILTFNMSQITFKRGYLATQPYYILPKKTCYLSQVA